MQRDPGRPATTSPKDFWKERFGRYDGEEKERDKDKKTAEGNEEKEEAVPPKKIDGIGDEAFWASNRIVEDRLRRRFAHFKLGKTAPKCRQKGLVRRHQIALRAGACCRRPSRRTLEQPDRYLDAASNVFHPTPTYS